MYNIFRLLLHNLAAAGHDGSPTVFVLIRVPPRGRLLVELKKAFRPWTAPKLAWHLVHRAVMTTL